MPGNYGPAIAAAARAIFAWGARATKAAAPYVAVGVLSKAGVVLLANHFATGPLLDYAKAQLALLSPTAVSVVAAVGFDKAISILLAAYSVRAASRIVPNKLPSAVEA